MFFHQPDLPILPYKFFVSLCVLIVVTGIFLFFPICIFFGFKVCWDIEVTGQKTVLLISSAIILLLCFWVWVQLLKDPKLESSSGKWVATLVIVLAVIISLIVIILGTSAYWAPLVGH